MTLKAKQVIEIGVDPETGLITCTPRLLHVHRGEFVGWKTPGPLAIQCLETTPFGRAEYQWPAGVYEEMVRENAPPGASRFACAMVYNGRIYLDARCPTFVIDQ
jgi:hypothetical protein